MTTGSGKDWAWWYKRALLREQDFVDMTIGAGNPPDSRPENAGAIDARAARRAFDRAARRYGGRSLLGDEIASRMASRLEYVRIEPTTVLDAGCGATSAKKWIGRRYPGATFVNLDASFAMLRATSPDGDWRARVRTWLGLDSHVRVCADMQALPLADESIDLVWSNLALNWTLALPGVINEFKRVLRPGGLLVISAYGADTLRELRSSFSAADRWPHVHQFMDMHDLGDMLVASRFAAPVMDMETISLSHATPDHLFQELRRSGETNSLVERRRGLMGRSILQAVKQGFPRAPSGSRVVSTFEIIHGHAWKGQQPAKTATPANGISKIQWVPKTERI